MKLIDILESAGTEFDKGLKELETHLKQIDLKGAEWSSSGFSSAAAYDRESARQYNVILANSKHKKQAEPYYKALTSSGVPKDIRGKAQKMWNKLAGDETAEKKRFAKANKQIAQDSVAAMIKVLDQLETNPNGKTVEDVIPRDANSNKAKMRKLRDEFNSLRYIQNKSTMDFITKEQDKVPAYFKFLKKKFGNAKSPNMWSNEIRTRFLDLM